MATYARCGGIFYNYCTANYLWKKLWKSVKIWQNCDHEFTYYCKEQNRYLSIKVNAFLMFVWNTTQSVAKDKISLATESLVYDLLSLRVGIHSAWTRVLVYFRHRPLQTLFSDLFHHLSSSFTVCVNLRLCPTWMTLQLPRLKWSSHLWDRFCNAFKSF